MNPVVAERSLEEAIIESLLENGPDGRPLPTTTIQEPRAPYGDWGGYHRRTYQDYDRALCLTPKDVIDFIQATQPKEWKRLGEHHGADVKERFLQRLSSEIAKRGALDVLRKGVKDSGCTFQLAYFRPATKLNPEVQKLYEANCFAVARQLRYSEKNENSLDLALFLNGIPIFTGELKNPLTGQNVQDAIKQYMEQRDPREPLLAFGRCLAHFAVDSDLVYVTTHLDNAKTRFLPFNQGKPWGAAGNPDPSPTNPGYATSYLWERIWARDSVLDLVRQFIHEVQDEGEDGKKTGKRFLIFPRYQQLDAVRKLVGDAKANGPGQRYLIQHSAGSGKSYTIAWLAHQLSTLHDADDKRVFDSIIVITDRRVLDRQLQQTVRQFEQTLGIVENIDQTSKQLKQALEEGKTIIVTTLQKFPVIANEIDQLSGHRFAVIVDEAHSSQTGDAPQAVKSVLKSATLEAAESEDTEEREPDSQDVVTKTMEARKWPKNTSVFAFTATPKQKTLELFGHKGAGGKPEAFHTYSMRQAIDEGFILDVLANYTTYKAYWRLLKKIEGDPRYDKNKASYLLKSFVELHPHAVDEKIRIMAEHFTSQTEHQINHKAKAMIVTRSRLHAVRYKLALDKYLQEQGHPWKALVAFSGAVQDGAQSYTESGMNGFSERQTAKTFGQSEYRFLVCAEKFQTGFDQPLLHTMYVDKRLDGVHAVQTLSRLNRTHPDKDGTAVLDFTNDADTIRDAFQPYYQTTILSEETDPNLLYEKMGRLLNFDIYTEDEVNAFADLFYDTKKTTQDQLYAALAPMVQRYLDATEDERHDFRGELTDYVRLYAFLSQVLPFSDADLEKLYSFARYLRRLLPGERAELPREVQENIDMESYRLQPTGSGKIALERGAGKLEPMGSKGYRGMSMEQIEPLSQIIAELNERFGLNLGPENRLTLGQMIEKLDTDAALDASARVNTRENVRLTFDQKVEDVIQEIVDSNFDLYRRITDDKTVGLAIKDYLFDQYLRTHRQADELLKQQESKTLEFKSSLRFNFQKQLRDDKAVTHSVLKTIAAFLNTEGGDLLIGVADDKSVLGIEVDDFKSEDEFMRHLVQVVQNGLGDRVGTRIDPKTQVVAGKTVCLVTCERSPEPVFLKWKEMEATPEGDFFVRSGPRTDKLPAESAAKYIETRFPGA